VESILLKELVISTTNKVKRIQKTGTLVIVSTGHVTWLQI